MPDPRYSLTLTEKQLSVLQSALDLYSRIGMGQYAYIADHPDVMARIWAVPEFTVDTVREPMEAFKQQFLELPRNAYFGISSNKISDTNRIAYDIQQVIRHRLAHDRAGREGSAERWQVQFSQPLATSKQPLPTMVEAGDSSQP